MQVSFIKFIRNPLALTLRTVFYNSVYLYQTGNMIK